MATVFIIIAIVSLAIVFVCGMIFTDFIEQKNISGFLILAGHSSILGATLWASILPSNWAALSDGIEGLNIAYWGVIFAGLLSYFASVYYHKQNTKNPNFEFPDFEDKLFLKKLSHQIILFGWVMFVTINASLGFVVTTGPLLLQASLVSLGLIHLVGMSFIGIISIFKKGYRIC